MNNQTTRTSTEPSGALSRAVGHHFPNGLDERLFPTGDVLERRVSERPQHQTLETIIDWLAGPVLHAPSLIGEFDEFAWRLLAAGFPLLRVTLQLRTLHPQYLGANFVWWRTTGRTVLTFVTHEVQDLYGHEDNPVRRVLVGGETLRRRIDVTDDALDFPILHDLKAEGATDYFALPIKSSFGTNYGDVAFGARACAHQKLSPR